MIWAMLLTVASLYLSHIPTLYRYRCSHPISHICRDLFLGVRYVIGRTPYIWHTPTLDLSHYGYIPTLYLSPVWVPYICHTSHIPTRDHHTTHTTVWCWYAWCVCGMRMVSRGYVSRDTTHSCVWLCVTWHDSFICVGMCDATWLNHVRGYVWRDMTHSYLCPQLFLCDMT